jgi:hypothetical protein
MVIDKWSYPAWQSNLASWKTLEHLLDVSSWENHLTQPVALVAPCDPLANHHGLSCDDMKKFRGKGFWSQMATTFPCARLVEDGWWRRVSKRENSTALFPVAVRGLVMSGGPKEVDSDRPFQTSRLKASTAGGSISSLLIYHHCYHLDQVHMFCGSL